MFLFAFFDFVERRLGDVNVTFFNNFRQLAIKKRQQQCANMRAINVRVGHDDDAVIT